MNLPYKEAMGVMDFTLGVEVVRSIDVMLTWVRGTWEPGNLSTWSPGDVGPRGWEQLPKGDRGAEPALTKGQSGTWGGPCIEG